MAELEQAQVEWEWEAFRQMRIGGAASKGAAGSEGEEPNCAESREDTDEGDLGSAKQRSSRRRVVTLRQNTMEVVIVRPTTKGKGPSGTVVANKVSRTILGRSSVLTVHQPLYYPTPCKKCSYQEELCIPSRRVGLTCTQCQECKVRCSHTQGHMKRRMEGDQGGLAAKKLRRAKKWTEEMGLEERKV